MSAKAKKVLGVVSAKAMKVMGQVDGDEQDLSIAAEYDGFLWRMLLVLKDGVWGDDEGGGQLAWDVRDALRCGMPILLAHETDYERGGRPFGQLLQQVPPQLEVTPELTSGSEPSPRPNARYRPPPLSDILERKG